jgi:hypothetical protein
MPLVQRIGRQLQGNIFGEGLHQLQRKVQRIVFQLLMLLCYVLRHSILQLKSVWHTHIRHLILQANHSSFKTLLSNGNRLRKITRAINVETFQESDVVR